MQIIWCYNGFFLKNALFEYDRGNVFRVVWECLSEKMRHKLKNGGNQPSRHEMCEEKNRAMQRVSLELLNLKTILEAQSRSLNRQARPLTMLIAFKMWKCIRIIMATIIRKIVAHTYVHTYMFIHIFMCVIYTQMYVHTYVLCVCIYM